MKHIPFFRWVLTLGVLLIGCSAGLYAAAPGLPELRQLDLTVLDEAPDGRCTVQWTDPFEGGEREGSYRCDPDRDPLLKAPEYDMGSGLGWESGFVVAEGADKGELYSLDEEEDDSTDGWIEASDTLVLIGLFLTATALIGGNIRATARLGGVRPKVVRRAERLGEAASMVAQDHARAVDAVRAAWAPLRREQVEEELRRMPVERLREEAGEQLRTGTLKAAGVLTVQEVLDAGAWELAQWPGVKRRTAETAVAAATGLAAAANRSVTVRLDANRPRARTTALVAAAHVLVAAGPQARDTAERGRELGAQLEPLLEDAAPATGYRAMLAAGPGQRRRARQAVTRLSSLLDEAERTGLAERFGQASVDLLRGADSRSAGLEAWVDFETRPEEYDRLLTELTACTDATHPSGPSGTGHL
ncbi:hypothetical protein ACFVS9_27675 [Streptomyces sp. NPDC058008]|uniref:hypothetical protein n=1 Tax=Streptomyces sp. NPDC058008 TaxID=3346303 RepID=UPI0036F01772